MPKKKRVVELLAEGTVRCTILMPGSKVHLLVKDGKVVEAPSVLRYMLGWDKEKIDAFTRSSKGWIANWETT